MKYIPLSGKRGLGKATLVCDCHYELVKPYRWWLNTNGYAYGYVRGKNTLMHLLIQPPVAGLETDHEDRTPLNNQCSNLRKVTRLENIHNRTQYVAASGIKGVYRRRVGSKQYEKWYVFRWRDGNKQYLGMASSITKARVMLGL